MSSKIFLRADGNSEIGMGHVIRSIALGSMLSEKFDCYLYTRYINSYINEECRRSDIQIKILDPLTHSDDFLEELSGDEIVVLDNYFFDSNYQHLIKQIGCKLVCIDDMSDKYFYSDIIINQNPAAKHIKYLTEPYCKLLLGLDYALLREAFRNKTIRSEYSPRLKNILLCFGGADSYNLTQKYASELLTNTDFSLEIILGSNTFAELDAIQNSQPSRITLHKNLDQFEMADVINSVDLAVVPTSSLLWEVIALGKPFLTGYFVDNQKGIAKFIESNYPTTYVGDFRNSNLMEPLKKIQNNYPNEVLGLIDGKSQERFLQEFENLM